MIRRAVPGDEALLARLHVASWGETYRGLLPDALIDGITVAERHRIWGRALEQGVTRIVLWNEDGFAQMGPQREDGLAAQIPEELWSMYLLRRAQGSGAAPALLRALRRGPFSACVLADNARACSFYAREGGRMMEERPGEIRGVPIRERLYGFSA